MYTVWKYEIEPDILNQVYKMPCGAVIISAGLDGFGKLCFWAQVNTEAPLEEHLVACIGTGWSLDLVLSDRNNKTDFVGTVVKGEYVWHIFDLGGVKGRLEKTNAGV